MLAANQHLRRTLVAHQPARPRNMKDEFLDRISTAGGRIECKRCSAKSKRTKRQCGAPAERGKNVCRFHGARSTGPKTKEGRQRITTSKTRHGDETRKARAERSAKSAEIASLEDILFLIKAATGGRTRGRKPAGYVPIRTLQAAYLYMLAHPITP
jgi:hypothetical protein